jgi:predicted MFS family arabinose efflux permease
MSKITACGTIAERCSRVSDVSAVAEAFSGNHLYVAFSRRGYLIVGRSPDRGVAPDPAADEPEPDWAEQPSTLRATFRPGLGLMLVNFGYVAVLSFGAAAATEQGTGIGSLVIPVFGVGVIASRTILAGIPDRFGPPRTLSVAVAIEAAGLAGMAVTTSPPIAVLALVVMAIGQGLAVPSLGMLALASVPPSRHGRTAGAFFA